MYISALSAFIVLIFLETRAEIKKQFRWLLGPNKNKKICFRNHLTFMQWILVVNISGLLWTVVEYYRLVEFGGNLWTLLKLGGLWGTKYLFLDH